MASDLEMTAILQKLQGASLVLFSTSPQWQIPVESIR